VVGVTKKWYPTTTTVDHTLFTADNENLASQTAPGSGSLTSTVGVSSTETSFLWVSPSGEPNVSDWPAASAGSTDYAVSLNVSSIGSSLSLVDDASRIASSTDDLTGTAGAWELTWSSTTGTGVKTTTLTNTESEAVDMSTRRILARVSVNHNGT